jgi:hypothetical protein
MEIIKQIIINIKLIRRTFSLGAKNKIIKLVEIIKRATKLRIISKKDKLLE